MSTGIEGIPSGNALIFENIFDFFGVLDPEGKVLSLSGRIFGSTNTNPDLLSGQVFAETVFWQSSEMTPRLIANAIAKASRGENARLVLDFRINADQKAVMEVSVQRIVPGQSLFICGRSILDAHDGAGQRRSSSEQLLFAAENAAIGLWFWDFEEDRIYATPRCNELFGLPAYEVFGFDAYREAIHPEDRGFVDEFLAASRETGKKYEEEFRVRYDDGSIEWIRAEGRSFLDENGKPRRMTGVVQKITEQKLAAEEVAKINEREKKARQDAVEANRAKDFFLAFVSHELRGPLNAIQGWSNILRTKPVDDETRKNAIAIIDRSARAQTKLINDLVDSARVASGKLRLEFRPTNLYDIVKNSWQAHMPTAQAKNIKLEFRGGEENIPLFGDSGRLQQVFGNLLSNAIKYTPDGGEVVVEIETGSDTVQVSVIDTGYGIDPAALPRIFDQFSQGDLEQTRTNFGLGLGLSIVKILVAKHRGTVNAASEGIGKGSRFTVSLPLTAGPVPDEGEPTERPVKTRPLEGSLIFIVEDDPDSREVLELFLTHNGASVKSFESVRLAMAGLASGKLPDVIVSDLGMPDEDGFSLIQKVRALTPETGGTVPAIALSAFTSEESRRKALELGFNKYCTKPFEHDQLISDLLSFLHQS